ncbi:MAG: glycosyltransferase family 4 protein [Gammaproteobacteria bacterium]|nr:glycosyltransferase family 4 protein [Gammaproteobacteria bacterium]
MKVFLNLLAATAGGQLSRARAFLDRFDDCAHNSQLIIIKEKSVLTEYVSTDRRLVIDVAIGLGWMKALRRTWWENVVMPEVIRRHKADVYLTFSHYLPQLRNIVVPSVVGVSNLAPFSTEAWVEEFFLAKIKMAVLRKTIISSARRATCVLALSETCRDILIQQGIPTEKIVVTPNGVDAYWGGAFQSTGFLTALGVTRPFLLYVSHFYRYKNHVRLIEAYARLPTDLRLSHQLVLVGKPYSKACYEETRMLIERLGLSSDVILIPGEGRGRLRELYQSAKLFVFPSLIENSPNILLEAMMAGSPVATSSLRPMPEFSGDAAEYFDALDIYDMSKKMENLLCDTSRLTDLGKRAHIRACRFTWDDFVFRVVRHLEMVKENRGNKVG